MSATRNDPHGKAVPTEGPLPPLTHGDVVEAEGDRLLPLDELGPRGVREVRTARHGVIAVGMADGRPFAVSNVCRHQLAKLGRGRVTDDGCLECPWHRARFDVTTGMMRSGPKGRVFGFKPYSAAVKIYSGVAPLQHWPVQVRNGAIWLSS